MARFTKRLLGMATACCLAMTLAGCMDADEAQQDAQAASSSAGQASESATESTASDGDAGSDGEDAANTGEDADETAREEPDTPEDVTESSPLFRLKLPGEIAQHVDFQWPEENCLAVYYGNVCVFEIAAYDTFEYHGSEWKHRVYSCGYAADADGWHDVTVTFPYIAGDGSGNAYWGDKDADVLSLSYLLGITDEDILPCIRVQVASGERLGTPRWDEIYPVLVSDDLGATSDRPLPSSSSSSAKPKDAQKEQGSPSSSSGAEEKERESSPNASDSPFWGVWAAAFKDAGNAESLAAEARANGWPEAGAYTSTDWGDLNPERWYVVSLQRCGSQEEAQSAAKKAQKQGYDGAYAKYTGDFIG